MVVGAGVSYGSGAIRSLNEAETLWEFSINAEDVALANTVYIKYFVEAEAKMITQRATKHQLIKFTGRYFYGELEVCQYCHAWLETLK